MTETERAAARSRVARVLDRNSVDCGPRSQEELVQLVDLLVDAAQTPQYYVPDGLERKLPPHWQLTVHHVVTETGESWAIRWLEPGKAEGADVKLVDGDSLEVCLEAALK